MSRATKDKLTAMALLDCSSEHVPHEEVVSRMQVMGSTYYGKKKPLRKPFPWGMTLLLLAVYLLLFWAIK